MSIHIAKLLQRTYISMLNGTFQSIFQHIFLSTHTYFIIETYSFTVPKKRQLISEIFAKGIYFYDLHMHRFEHFV